MSYQPPVREHLFLLRDVLQIEKYANLPGLADAPLDVVEQILAEAAKFSAEVLAAQRRRRQARLHLELRTGRSPPRPASRKPTSSWSTVAGRRWALTRRSVGRGCRR